MSAARTLRQLATVGRISSRQLCSSSVSRLPLLARTASRILTASRLGPAYPKVGLFLLTVLAKELRAGRKDPAFMLYTSGNQILDAFKIQFESYTRQYPPFSARSPVWSRPIQYWNAMSQQPEAAIIAFVAIKVFSILPNSMADERTVSRFTRNDSVDRAKQDASTIVDMTKIYQHIQRESLSTKKSSQKNSKSSPTMNWRSVKGLMTEAYVEIEPTPTDAPAAAKTAPKNSRTVASEAGLVALNTVDDPDTPSDSLSAVGAASIDSHRDGVDITLPFFRDLLSDKPIPGADEVGSLANWPERADGSTKKQKKATGNTTWEGDVATLTY